MRTTDDAVDDQSVVGLSVDWDCCYRLSDAVAAEPSVGVAAAGVGFVGFAGQSVLPVVGEFGRHHDGALRPVLDGGNDVH